MTHVVVVGAGVGGLGAAVRLAAQGHRVTILEKNTRPGGKMNLVEEGGFRFDTGPSLITLPGVLAETFRAAGRRIEDYLTLKQLDPITRYRFADGTQFDLSPNLPRLVQELGNFAPDEVTGFFQFLAHGRVLFERAGPIFLMRERPGPRDLISPRAPDALRIDAHVSLHRAARSFFRDPRMLQLVGRYATYNGSSPYKAPGTLAMIPYIEWAGGGWYIEGGLYKLVEALVRVAEELGVNVQTGCEVSEITVAPRLGLKGPRATGVRLKDGGYVEAGAVMVNADPIYAYDKLVPEAYRHRRLMRRIERLEPSCSGFVLLLGVKGDWAGLAHHNIYFSNDYRAEFRAIFNRREPAEEPTIYVAATSKSDPTQAPPGHQNLFVLVNAPALTPEADWERWKGPYRQRILSMLEAAGLSGLRSRVVYEKVITPQDFATQYNSWHGSIYGLSSNSRFTAFMRPPNRAPGLANLLFVGGSVHPGGGIPLVLLSARLVSRMVR